MSNNLERIKKMLETLSNAHGVSGHEGSSREILTKKLGPYTNEIKIDKLGNLITTKFGEGPSVMLSAHMDEIGLSTNYISDEGFLHFIGIGGWFDQTLLNQRVKVHGSKGDLFGVIGSKPAHLLEEEETKKPIKIKDMFIDIGASDEKMHKNLALKLERRLP